MAKHGPSFTYVMLCYNICHNDLYRVSSNYALQESAGHEGIMSSILEENTQSYNSVQFSQFPTIELLEIG